MIERNEMNRPLKYLLLTLVALGVVACAFVAAVSGRGFSARDEPTMLETLAARAARRMAVPSDAYSAVNPLEATPEVIADGLSHFADHCASCHANDGSGDTPIGRNLYPKAPDMRESETQSLTDGELFYVITNGIRLTGMPAWGSGSPDEDHGSWALVHFIRRLPNITEDELAEMGKLNPVSPSQLAADEVERQFLEGGAPAKQGHDHQH